MTATTRRHALVLIVLAVAVAVSGCQAPGANTGPTTPETPVNDTETPDAGDGPFPLSDPVNITVDGAPVEPDPGLIHDRLQVLLETDTPAPERIQSYNNTTGFANSAPGGLQLPSRFFRVVGFETGPVENTFIDRVGNGYTLGLGSVAVYVSPNATRNEAEMLLAHELTHYIQFQNERQQALAAELDIQTVDGSYVLRSLLEGPAVVATDNYLREFSENGTLNSPYYDREQKRYPPGHIGRWSNSRYQIGTDYVTSQIGSLSDIGEIYEDPPTRSRELLDPDAGQRPALATVLEHDREQISSNRLGAAFTRFGLESHVDPSRAEAVAEGFGTDTLYQYSSGQDTYGNYVWVTRWESEADAERFNATITDYFDARGNQTTEGWRLSELGLTVEVRSAGADTRALVVGSASFVDETVISGRQGAVTIESDEG
ncbi:hypothetical protein [Halovenus halobia]|uniref:hypothetical protein n=1 Tax=Halovenus halobia TaxID=3396622 RepID=UPI003F54E280